MPFQAFPVADGSWSDLQAIIIIKVAQSGSMGIRIAVVIEHQRLIFFSNDSQECKLCYDTEPGLQGRTALRAETGAHRSSRPSSLSA